jgi:hypothetical protein
MKSTAFILSFFLAGLAAAAAIPEESIEQVGNLFLMMKIIETNK